MRIFKPDEDSKTMESSHKRSPVCEDLEYRFVKSIGYEIQKQKQIEEIKKSLWYKIFRKLLFPRKKFIEQCTKEITLYLTHERKEKDFLKTATISKIKVEGLLRYYPENYNPRFFTKGFVAAYENDYIEPITGIHYLRLYRMFDMKAFEGFIDEYNETTPEKNLFRESFWYQYIKTQCEIRDKLIQNNTIHTLFGYPIFR